MHTMIGARITLQRAGDTCVVRVLHISEPAARGTARIGTSGSDRERTAAGAASEGSGGTVDVHDFVPKAKECLSVEWLGEEVREIVRCYSYNVRNNELAVLDEFAYVKMPTLHVLDPSHGVQGYKISRERRSCPWPTAGCRWRQNRARARSEKDTPPPWRPHCDGARGIR